VDGAAGDRAASAAPPSPVVTTGPEHAVSVDKKNVAATVLKMLEEGGIQPRSTVLPDPELPISGSPDWNVMWFSKPDALMASALSTVITLLTPDTWRLAQWPVMVTLLETPLTLTMFSLQSSVLFSPTPETLSRSPGGAGSAGATDGAGSISSRPAVLGVVVSNEPPPAARVGFVTATPLVNELTEYTIAPPANAIKPTTTTPMISPSRPRCGGGGAPNCGPPFQVCGGIG
jgi:hypothetical protein